MSVMHWSLSNWDVTCDDLSCVHDDQWRSGSSLGDGAGFGCHTQWPLSVGEGINQQYGSVKYAISLPDHMKISGRIAEEGFESPLHGTFSGISNPSQDHQGTSQRGCTLLLTMQCQVNSTTAFLPSSLGWPDLCRLWQGCSWDPGKANTLWWGCWCSLCSWIPVDSGTKWPSQSKTSIQSGIPSDAVGNLHPS